MSSSPSALRRRLRAIALDELADHAISPGEARDLLDVLACAQVALESLTNENASVSWASAEALLLLKERLRDL